jgi:glycosyltransferase involved in cell wall biosynthesis
MRLVYFHRNLKGGFSINKVTQTIIRNFSDKEEFYMPEVGASLKNIIRNIWFVYKNRDKNAINHVTGDIHYCILGLIGCRSVLTIHDTVGVDLNISSTVKKKIIEWLWFRIPIKFATKIVCISEATKQSIKRFTKRTDIEVIHNAIDPIFENVKLFDTHNEMPVVLMIGCNPNKNLIRCFEALAGISCRVVIVGILDDSQKEALSRFNIEYENLFNLTDAEIVEQYQKCDIVSFVSLFEGFGMIIIEANKVGKPVICSDIPVLREVAADSALFVDPLNVRSIRAGYQRIINDKELQSLLISRGSVNVRRFDRNIIETKWLQLYESLMNE